MPVPSDVLLFVMVGFWLMLQQTPRAVTDAPPSLVTLPPLLAEVEVTAVNAVVVNIGNEAVVVTDSWFP